MSDPLEPTPAASAAPSEPFAPPAEAAAAGDPVEASEGGRTDFPCANCGAKAVWDPEVDALRCDYCGESTPVPRAEGTVLERPLDEADLAERGFGLELKVAQCSECGARVAFEGVETAQHCVYCGSASVLAQTANRNAIRPESVVPLDVGARQVEVSFRQWAKGLWFRPNALKHAHTTKAVGVYVPFWTFDCRVHSDWSADAGHYYYVTVPYMVVVNGKPQMRMRQERRVRWVPAWGQRDDAYDDELVNASKGLPRALLARLGGFDTQQLVPYRPEYLAGWRAEEYQLDLHSGWEQGQAAVEDSQRARCSGDVPGDTQRNLRVHNLVADVRWKHVLLPVWSLQYPLGGKIYTVLVNGQSGRIAGEAPYSWNKILGLVLAVAVVALLVVAMTMGF
ncbi:MAG TPA: zinc ribbon domain-containing protein [Planctomycetota bacterium]